MTVSQTKSNAAGHSVLGVVVTFHPDKLILINILALLAEVDRVMIVDNGSGTESLSYIKELEAKPNVSVVYNNNNLGVAAALNIGVEFARKHHYHWLATYDQDSLITEGMIAVMLNQFDELPDKESVAILSPVHKDQTTGRFSNPDIGTKHQSQTYKSVLTVITSGNLVRMDVFEQVGTYNEAMFIDYVDNEFCLRCVSCGLLILEIQNAILEHNLGAPTQHKLFWKNPIVTNHGVIRRYYIARNRMYTYKKFFTRYPRWVVDDIFAFVKEIIKLILFEQQRVRKLKMVCQGCFHGLIGRMGVYENSMHYSA